MQVFEKPGTAAGFLGDLSFDSFDTIIDEHNLGACGIAQMRGGLQRSAAIQRLVLPATVSWGSLKTSEERWSRRLFSKSWGMRPLNA